MSSILLQSFERGLRICSGSFYLLFILISIPISFNIGGLYCGLSFTVTLFNLYFVSTTLNFIAKKTCNRFFTLLTNMLYYCQHLIIASLLYLFLSGFDSDDLANTISKNIKPTETNWLFYYHYYNYVVHPWQLLLSYATPFFTMSEGFFTILAIQAIGETNKWLSYEKKSNTWIISSLLTSGGVITASLYYLYRIYVTPIWNLSIQTASLLGFVLSLVGGLGVYGIVSETGSVIESSLFFAYIVRCIYEISPKLATTATEEIFSMVREVWQVRQGSLPFRDDLIFHYGNVILKNFQTIWGSLVDKTANTTYSYKFDYSFFLSFTNIRNMFQPIWRFFKNFTISVPFSINELFWIIFKMASESVSPAVIINLCFRILIFYSATRIIPALQRKNSRERRRSRRFMRILYWYSPCILIAMYTHLILQYSGELKNELCLWGCNSKWLPLSLRGDSSTPPIVVDAWGFWNWCNIFWTILIYSNELFGTAVNNNNSTEL